MNTYIINKIHALFNNTLTLSETDSIKLKYMLDVIVNDILKFTIMIIIFNYFGHAVTFIHCLISIALIRTFTGGLHMKSFFGCLSFSTFFISISILLINNISITLPLLILLYAFSLTVVVLLAPITPKQRPKYPKKKLFRFKMIGVSMVVIHFLLYLVTEKNPYFIASTWVLFLQSIQLLIAYGGIKYEKIKSNVKITTRSNL